MRRLVPLLPLALVLVACQPPAPAGLSDADKAAIKATVAAAEKIANTSPFDAAAYVKAYYAPDANLLPPNAAAVTTTDGLVAFFKGFPPITSLKFTSDEIVGVGDQAWVRGTYQLVLAPPGAPGPVEDRGKFLEVWKKQADGSWKSYRDVFNSDMPPAPAPAPEPTKKK